MWRAAQLVAKLKQWLAPLDKLDTMTGSATETDVLQLRYNLLAVCADATQLHGCFRSLRGAEVFDCTKPVRFLNRRLCLGRHGGSCAIRLGLRRMLFFCV